MGDLANNEAIVTRWGNGLANGMVGLEGILSPTARIWHSNDGEWLSRDVAQQRMIESQSARPAPTSGFRDVRSHATVTGGVIQAVVDLDGGVAHIVQMLTVEGDEIVALEEYIAPQDA